MQPVVIAVAMTGSVPRKKDNPAVPINVAEQVESTQEAYEAELVSLAAEAVRRHGRRIATPAEARARLGLAA